MTDRTQRLRRRRSKERHAICARTGKRRYRDGDDAALALKHLQRLAASAELHSAEHHIRVVRKYACDLCGGWHLTSWSSYGRVQAA